MGCPGADYQESKALHGEHGEKRENTGEGKLIVAPLFKPFSVFSVV
jgi:hypothetical protein